MTLTNKHRTPAAASFLLLAWCAAVLMLAALHVPASAQEPAPVPQSPAPKITAVKSGGLTILDSAGSQGCESLLWLCVPEITEGWLIVDDGARAILAPARGGAYVVVLVGCAGEALGSIRLLVQVGAPSPDPGPGPGPEPEFSWRTFTAGLAAEVESAKRAAEALAVAEAFETVAAMIAAGAIDNSDSEAVSAATKAATERAVGAGNASWTPFFAALSAELERRSELAALDHAAVWGGIGAGLRDSVPATQEESE